MIGASDTIVAVATASGPAGVGVVRLSGPEAAAIVAHLTGRSVADFVDRRLTRAVLRDGSGARLDEALCVVMRGPRSFTGEDVAEIHGHGGTLNLTSIVRATISLGARLAEPGEFSRRAFTAGRIDLLAAEALLAVVEAGSERALRVAQAQLAGGLGRRVAELAGETTSLLADLEAAMDFPEEDLGSSAPANRASALTTLASAASSLAETFVVGRALRDGISVALRGPVNAGKSSLFNALLGCERALVDGEPGTTRDYLEAGLVWDGVPITLVDTAGERPVGDDTERRGIELGARRAAEADVEIWLLPLGTAVHSHETAAISSAPAGRARRLVIASKADLMATVDHGVLATSAVSGAGLEDLRRSVLALVFAGAGGVQDDAVVTSERQRDLLGRAAAALGRAAAAVAAGHPEEVVALEVREAAAAFATVRGEREDEAVLDSLFARYCIGK